MFYNSDSISSEARFPVSPFHRIFNMLHTWPLKIASHYSKWNKWGMSSFGSKLQKPTDLRYKLLNNCIDSKHAEGIDTSARDWEHYYLLGPTIYILTSSVGEKASLNTWETRSVSYWELRKSWRDKTVYHSDSTIMRCERRCNVIVV